MQSHHAGALSLGNCADLQLEMMRKLKRFLSLSLCRCAERKLVNYFMILFEQAEVSSVWLELIRMS